MNTKRILDLLENPSLLNFLDTELLKEESEKYPYSHFLQAIYVKSLISSGENFDAELKKLISISSDKFQLEKFLNINFQDFYKDENVNQLTENEVDSIEEEIFIEEENQENYIEENNDVSIIETEQQKDIEVEINEEIIPKEILISENITENKKDEVYSFDESLELLGLSGLISKINNKSTENYNVEIQVDSQNKEEEELQQQKEQETDFEDENNDDEVSTIINNNDTTTSNDKLKFEDWLFLNNPKKETNPNKNSEPEIKNEVTKDNDQSKIIDNFIEKMPKIKPVRESSPTQLTINSNDDYPFEHIITETIANLYKEQHKYDKAILAYENLSLKYPEKSVYFAGLIEEIKNLKNPR